MKYTFLAISFFWISGVSALEGFDSSCYREVATIDTNSGVSSVQVQNTTDDIFFSTTFGDILPSRLENTKKNPPVQYTSKDFVDIPLLDDSDPYTGIEINPTLFLKGEVSYVFDLGKIYTRGQIKPEIGFVTDRNISVSLSIDGNLFIPVTLGSIGNFDFRFIKIGFSGNGKQTEITRFHTLNFFQNIQNTYVFSSPGGEVRIFRGYACTSQSHQYPMLDRPKLPYTEIIPDKSYTPIFLPNPLYKDDGDSDGFENIRDNCPIVNNPDQNDRNNDGIGDACDDSDGDNRYGFDDNCPTISNPDQADKNANKIGDACEFDTDKDGVFDDLDNAIHMKNPDQADIDRDGIGDVMDNCNLYNPDQLDLDKNGRGDVCDKNEEYRRTNDLDKDTILDYLDNCSKMSNQNQADSDIDGIGDVCDNCKELKNPEQSDIDVNGVGDSCEDVDHDGVVGWRDNCPSISNPDQKDSDNNRVGDICSDIDGDGKYDEVDNCPTVFNDTQYDIDKDGKGDVCDADDNRFIESNKYVFMALVGIFGLIFIGGIIVLIRKLQ